MKPARARPPVLPVLILALVPAAGAPSPERKPGNEPPPAKPPAVLAIAWHGQACMEVLTPEGLNVLMDPAGNIGFPLPDFRPDVVTVSHEHFDHNNLEIAKGKPRVLRGLSDDKKSCRAVDETVKGVRIRTVASAHDDQGGKARGPNAVFVLEGKGWSLAHLGDLGIVPTPEQAKAIGTVDVLLCPVGGKYTIDGAAAKKVVALLKPRRLAIPMHFKVPGLRVQIADASAFLEGAKNVRKVEGPRIEIDVSAPPPAEPGIAVLVPAEAKEAPADAAKEPPAKTPPDAKGKEPPPENEKAPPAKEKAPPAKENPPAKPAAP